MKSQCIWVVYGLVQFPVQSTFNTLEMVQSLVIVENCIEVFHSPVPFAPPAESLLKQCEYLDMLRFCLRCIAQVEVLLVQLATEMVLHLPPIMEHWQLG